MARNAAFETSWLFGWLKQLALVTRARKRCKCCRSDSSGDGPFIETTAGTVRADAAARAEHTETVKTSSDLTDLQCRLSASPSKQAALMRYLASTHLCKLPVMACLRTLFRSLSVKPMVVVLSTAWVVLFQSPRSTDKTWVAFISGIDMVPAPVLSYLHSTGWSLPAFSPCCLPFFHPSGSWKFRRCLRTNMFWQPTQVAQTIHIQCRIPILGSTVQVHKTLRVTSNIRNRYKLFFFH